MKQKVALGIGFTAVFSVSLIVHMPASWLYRQVAPLQGVALEGVSGTVFAGKAVNVRYQGQNLGHVDWQMKPWALLLANAKFAVDFGKGSDLGYSGAGIVGYRFSGPYASDLVATMPAEKVMTFSPMPLPIEIAGQFELRLEEYQWAAPYCAELAGELIWLDGAVVSPLGNIDAGWADAALSCEDGAAVVKAEQESDALTSDWLVSLKANNTYVLDGGFTPGEAFPDMLRSQLRYVGNPDGKGRYSFKFSGQF
uniref:type II secretion system protein N n=1 Tax=Thaumasiovibrio occultus TaxID=1891184 RepID=UPI000B35C954|nr:type II secretion system protein N [Thaumasiovibrio occultus]